MGAVATAPAVDVTVEAPTERASGYYLEIFLVSLAALLLEISYTRVISFKLFYYFTYFVIGLALLGLGAGGVAVAVSGRLRRAATDSILLWCMILGGVAIGLGYLVVAVAPINTFEIWDYGTSTVKNGSMLLVFCLIMFVSFLPIGVILSTLFGRRPEKMAKLYFADLFGAAIACAIAVPLIASAGPPSTIMLAGLLLVVATVRIGVRRRGFWPVVSGVIALLLLVGVVAPDAIPDVKLDSGKRNVFSDAKLVYSSWSPLFRVDVREFPGQRGLFHDGLLGSVMLQWDGKKSSLDKFGFDNQYTVLPFSTGAPAPKRELIVGAAAGHEVVASLHFGADKIDAIELNPVTFDLVKNRMADYGGHVAEQPGVHYVNADGRSYLARSDKRYDLIWYPAPDSYSATNSSSASAFVLSESYLYTTDAVKDSLEHLAPGGLLVNQFGDIGINRRPTRAARYVNVVRKALEDLGVRDPERHIVVSTEPGSFNPPLTTILTKMEPFTDAEVADYAKGVSAIKGATVVYAPGRIDPTAPITKFAAPEAAGPSRYTYPFSVDAISDNKPFFWHYTPFSRTVRQFDQPITAFQIESSVGERVLVLLLVFAVALSVLFLLAPFFAIRKTWALLPRKGISALYFIAIGMGFMFFEITMIQRLVLFLGYPTYSLTVTLSSLLIFVGLGSLLSGRLTARGRGVVAMLVAVALITAYLLFGLTSTTDALLDLALGLRIAIAFVLLAPLGLSLGVFMPLGVRTVASLSDHSQEYVAWAWALNGFASVVGSVLATILAMTYGFAAVLVLALVAYVVAFVAIQLLARNRTATST
jgi:hypothetical protein